jgi:molybdopterin synthase catalytic subunit
VTRVRLFAALRELAGASSLEVEADDVGSVLDQLSGRLGPEFDRIMAAGSVMVNGERSGRDRVVTGDDDVALLPPVSGGQERRPREYPWFRAVRFCTTTNR